MNNSNVFDNAVMQNLNNIDPTIRFAVWYWANWLTWKLFIAFMIIIILIFIVHNIKEQYKWQRYWYYLFITLSFFSYFAEFNSLFTFSIISLGILIIISSWSFLKDTYTDLQLQKVEATKFKKLSWKNIDSWKNFNSIREALKEDWHVAIQLLIEYLNKEYGELIKPLIIATIITILSLIIEVYIIYLLYSSEYFIR